MKQAGAIEIGKRNTLVLAIAHIFYYLAAIVEGSFRSHDLNIGFWIGVCLYGLGVIMLITVIRLLGRLWTVKLLIAKDHELITHPLFRWFRHPNYFLNIIPELVGFALILNAHITLVIGMLVYAIPLTIRIRQEEREMNTRFPGY
ncbi:isoprenylcysteine carboxylmethyltransferase family protein [Oryzifoliimicrobium ureilyticus]|uniref:isoprenylcysteine carboxylmethyltransferase family protein n=1 Tax=Oryzifoliimicrobium ureilyticus TaxID=3113724 RepID=UPI0030766B3B